MPPHGSSSVLTSHADLLLFCQEWMSTHTAKEALWDSHSTSAFSWQCHDAPHHNCSEKFKQEQCLQDTGSKSSCPLMGPHWSVVLHLFIHLKLYCKSISIQTSYLYTLTPPCKSCNPELKEFLRASSQVSLESLSKPFQGVMRIISSV